MAQTSRTSQEYWRPANPDFVRLVGPTAAAETCRRCGMEYSPGARFCHVCGASREPAQRNEWLPIKKARAHPVLSWPLSLHLPLISLLCFLLGVGCVVGAAVMGAIYKTDTLVDWQAVQIWRIEWLLASIASMLAGLLLKKTEP